MKVPRRLIIAIKKLLEHDRATFKIIYVEYKELMNGSLEVTL